MTLRRDKPLIYLISDGSLTNENYQAKSAEFLQLIEVAKAVHLPLVQVREKNLSARRLYELTALMVKLTRGSQTKVLVNDRVDIAMAAQTDGVHLTSRSIPLEIVRGYMPDDFLIGISTHTTDEVDAARNARADFAVFGPVFEVSGKGDPIGVESLRNAAIKYSDFPLLALGGIDETNYHNVLAAGVAGFAAIRFLNDSQNLETLSEEFGL